MNFDTRFMQIDDLVENVFIIRNGLVFEIDLACESEFFDFSETEHEDWYILNLWVAHSGNLVEMMKTLNPNEFETIQEEAIKKLFEERVQIQIKKDTNEQNKIQAEKIL